MRAITPSTRLPSTTASSGSSPLVTRSSSSASKSSTSSTAPINPATCDATKSQVCDLEKLDLLAVGVSRLPPAPPPRAQDPAPVSDPTTSAAATSNLTTLSPPIAPLSTGPDTNVVELSSGGSTGVPGTQDIAYGGGGPSLNDCMSLWDKTTDMSKSEWKDTCTRTMNGTELSPDDLSHVADVDSIIGGGHQATHAAKSSRHVARGGKTTNTQTAASVNTRKHVRPQHEAELE
jgi:hypothetical protein